jgi:hypothetical protein
MSRRAPFWPRQGKQGQNTANEEHASPQIAG